MSDWTWEYVPDAPNVVGGLTQAQIDPVESLASRIADAVAVRRIGTSFDVTESTFHAGVSPLRIQTKRLPPGSSERPLRTTPREGAPGGGKQPRERPGQHADDTG
jgi:hypothetical protein